VCLGAFERQQLGTFGAPMRVACHLRRQDPAREITQLAADMQADLVVVGMRDRGGLSRFFLGSVAENVARLAPCSVLVFRPKRLARDFELPAEAGQLGLHDPARSAEKELGRVPDLPRA
jgi:hypothetical protein